ncbi:hypothetical protein [Haloferula rosea]|uniref:Uncharacterized protein n=1 Tax=Haloferula rosea TaxID=490093 RepID=A0A934RGE6_9BACT|nr:hypothetical protein [Haloferula rosea]MBK1829078.1 hypothetical protein [Haloferula rosea]
MKIAASILAPLQTGGIFGALATVVLYQLLGFASSSRYYQDGERLMSAGGIFFLVALISSVLMIFLPKQFGMRSRGTAGCAITIVVLFLKASINPQILPETRESLKEYRNKNSAEPQR